MPGGVLEVMERGFMGWSVYFVGGFGGAHYIGYIPIDLYRSAVPSEAEPDSFERFRIEADK
ncbi:hypothetical protein FRC05_003015 [Tulasnella sp. 425]|nr:hypothetical protein FRC05_003015 [Tulasnella sp. 425]